MTLTRTPAGYPGISPMQDAPLEYRCTCSARTNPTQPHDPDCAVTVALYREVYGDDRNIGRERTLPRRDGAAR